MKVLLIIGSNSDVGQACAHTFAKEGFTVFLATRNVNDYQKRLAADLRIRYTIKAENFYFDAEKFEEHQAFYDSLPLKPQVVLSVVGYLGNHEKALDDFEESNKILTSNMTGCMSILNVVANDMEKRKEGAILAVSSVAGERGRQSNYIYGAAKAGLTTYLSGLRNRLSASNVHVGTIIPGFINTKMIEGLSTPKPLTANPQQVADVIWKSYKKRHNVVYVLGIWRFIMFVIKSIPESMFKKMNL